MRKMVMLVSALSAAVGFCQEAPKPAEPQALKSYVWVKEAPDKSDLFMQDVAAFFEKNDYFYLATVDGQGARVRPIRYTVVADNKLLVATSTKKEMYGQLVKSPCVELSRTAKDDSAYIRYKGKAALCADADVKAKFAELQPSMAKKFGADLALFFVEPEMIGIFPMKGGQAKTKVFTK
jgi:uncharacterized pyridoxamine 5'-phosphate oxidase family protein